MWEYPFYGRKELREGEVIGGLGAGRGRGAKEVEGEFWSVALFAVEEDDSVRVLFGWSYHVGKLGMWRNFVQCRWWCKCVTLWEITDPS